MSTNELFEFEVHRASQDELKLGETAAEVVKVLVAETNWWEAYKTAVDVTWRPDRMVTACKWVP